MTKSRKIISGMVAAGIVLTFIASMPLTKVLLSSYPVALADIATGQSHPEWKDGVYIGRSVNQRGEADALEVRIAEGRFRSIRDINDQGTSLVSDKVLREIIPVILKKNSADVDTVSGATVSSRGIIDAVNNAVQQATD